MGGNVVVFLFFEARSLLFTCTRGGQCFFFFFLKKISFKVWEATFFFSEASIFSLEVWGRQRFFVFPNKQFYLKWGMGQRVAFFRNKQYFQRAVLLIIYLQHLFFFFCAGAQEAVHLERLNADFFKNGAGRKRKIEALPSRTSYCIPFFFSHFIPLSVQQLLC